MSGEQQDLLPPTLAEQIAEVERELNLRHHVYPRLLQSKRILVVTANRQMRNLRAALETLLRLEEALD